MLRARDGQAWLALVLPLAFIVQPCDSACTHSDALWALLVTT